MRDAGLQQLGERAAHRRLYDQRDAAACFVGEGIESLSNHLAAARLDHRLTGRGVSEAAKDCSFKRSVERRHFERLIRRCYTAHDLRAQIDADLIYQFVEILRVLQREREAGENRLRVSWLESG